MCLCLFKCLLIEGAEKEKKQQKKTEDAKNFYWKKIEFFHFHIHSEDRLWFYQLLFHLLGRNTNEFCLKVQMLILILLSNPQFFFSWLK